MNEKERQSLIAGISARVLRELGAAPTAPERPFETVAVISAPLVLPDRVFNDVTREFGPSVRYLIFDDRLRYPKTPGVRVTPEEEQGYTEETAAAKSLLLLSPKVSTLLRIADGDDAGPVENLTIRALLWRKEVHIWLDFLPMLFKRNTFYEKIIDALDAFEDMGVKVSAFDRTAELVGTTLLTLVSERDVLEALEEGKAELTCAPGAIVTPSAKDRAAMGDLIIRRAEAYGGPAFGSKER